MAPPRRNATLFRFAAAAALGCALPFAAPPPAQATPFPRDLSARHTAAGTAGSVVEQARATALRAPERRPARRNAVGEATAVIDHALRSLAPLGVPAHPFASLRGQLPPPVRDGAPAATFGTRRRPDSPTRSAHHGWSWRVPIGVPVHAIGHGVVVVAEFVPGLGGVLIIDHGEDYHSVLAQLVEIHVIRGNPVAPGDPVGRGGHMSTFGEREVYLEIRHMGVALDPAGWLRPSAGAEGR